LSRNFLLASSPEVSCLVSFGSFGSELSATVYPH
jgi:hypothetical protein